MKKITCTLVLFFAALSQTQACVCGGSDKEMFEKADYVIIGTAMVNPDLDSRWDEFSDTPGKGSNVLLKVESVVKGDVKVKEKIFIYQQVKEEDIELLQKIYKKNKISCEIKSFFTDMNEKLAESNLVIARSGASTIAELIEIAVPGILIPLPSSADNHQDYNAKEMDEKNAGWLIEEGQNAQANLRNLVKSIEKDSSILKECSEQLKTMQQDSCQNIINIIQKI